MSTNQMVDLANASTEAVAIFAAILDIRSVIADKAVRGFNVWMKLWWLVYGVWQVFIAFHVGLPITGYTIAVWVPVYIFSTVQAFHYYFTQRREARS